MTVEHIGFLFKDHVVLGKWHRDVTGSKYEALSSLDCFYSNMMLAGEILTKLLLSSGMALSK